MIPCQFKIIHFFFVFYKIEVGSKLDKNLDELSTILIG